MLKVWLDDNRVPPDSSWTWVKTYLECVNLLKTKVLYGEEILQEMAFDNDLGWCETCQENDRGIPGKNDCACVCHREGYHVLEWMETSNIWPVKKPVVHSQNWVRRPVMQQIIDRKYGA